MGKVIKIEGLDASPQAHGKALKSVFKELTDINDEAITLLQKINKENIMLRKLLKGSCYVILLNMLAITYCLFRG